MKPKLFPTHDLFAFYSFVHQPPVLTSTYLPIYFPQRVTRSPQTTGGDSSVSIHIEVSTGYSFPL